MLPVLTNQNTVPEDLGMGDFDLLRLFSLKINDNGVTDHLLMKIQYISRCNLSTLHEMKKRIEELSELMAESYDCCTKSCVAFTGPHSKLKACPRCRKPRYRLNGQPVKVYRYIPFIPQLVVFFLNCELNERMRCRAQEWASDIWPENPGKPRGIEGYKSRGERTKEE